jgi:hypothetical protein
MYSSGMRFQKRLVAMMLHDLNPTISKVTSFSIHERASSLNQQIKQPFARSSRLQILGSGDSIFRTYDASCAIVVLRTCTLSLLVLVFLSRTCAEGEVTGGLLAEIYTPRLRHNMYRTLGPLGLPCLVSNLYQEPYI